MKELSQSRRRFLKAVGLTTGAVLLSSGSVVAESGTSQQSSDSPAASSESGSSDYTLHIKTSPVEIAPNRIISAATYNGQFPGPLLRFTEGQQVTATSVESRRACVRAKARTRSWFGCTLRVSLTSSCRVTSSSAINGDTPGRSCSISS